MKYKLKILFITSDKFPLFRPAARAIFCEDLAARGYEIDWLLQAESACDRTYRTRLGNGYAYIGSTDDGKSRFRRLRKHLLDLANDLRIFKLVRENQYDLIQVKDKYISAIFAILVAKIYKLKFFYWLAFPHAEASLYKAKRGIARYRLFYLLRGLFFKFVLYRIVLPAADHVFVQSEQMKKDIDREGISEEKMTPVPGSVNLKDIPFYAKPNNVSVPYELNAKTIVYLGTLNRMRKLNFLIRVFDLVKGQVPEAKLYFIGKGDMPEDEDFLKAEVIRQGLSDSVVFTGYLPMSVAWEYIRNSDVCVSPYYPTMILNSTSPTKLIEYMAMAKPVVGNDHPEQSLVISSSRAGICVPWDESAFADAIVKILNDPSMAKEMGLRGRSYVEKYRSNRIMADTVERAYFQICGLS